MDACLKGADDKYASTSSWKGSQLQVPEKRAQTELQDKSSLTGSAVFRALNAWR